MTKEGTRAKTKGLSIKEKFENVLNILHEDKECAEEYDCFVKGVSYASNASTVSFSRAIEAFKD